MADKKTDKKAKATVTGLTVRQLLEIDQAIDMVSELKFPMKTSYQLSKTKNQMESRIKSYNKTIQELREDLRTKKDEHWIIPEKNETQWREESEALLGSVEDLELRTFPVAEFDFTEDDHYSKTIVPQGFITLMFPLLTE